jgi:hypothetical protein
VIKVTLRSGSLWCDQEICTKLLNKYRRLVFIAVAKVYLTKSILFLLVCLLHRQFADTELKEHKSGVLFGRFQGRKIALSIGFIA